MKSYNLKMDKYKEISKKITSYITKLAPANETIDDVAQDVFIKIHQSIHTLKDKDKLDSWLKRIVYTTLMDSHRTQQRNNLRKLMPTIHDETQNEGNVALLECVSELLKLLPDEQRDLLQQVELNGMSQTEYAKLYSLPLSTVKSRIQRARRNIKATIKNSCVLTNDKYGNVVDFILPQKLK